MSRVTEVECYNWGLTSPYKWAGAATNSPTRGTTKGGFVMLPDSTCPYDPKSIESFWRRVDVRGPDECWPWRGSCYVPPHGGYGRVKPKLDGIFVERQAHRLAFETAVGPIPEGLLVCHSCDNPPCCNPDHLWLGTHADNMADKMAKDRQPRGSDHGRAHLTDQLVLTARRLKSAGWLSRAIADFLGHPYGTVDHAISGRTWKHLPGAVSKPRGPYRKSRRESHDA